MTYFEISGRSPLFKHLTPETVFCAVSAVLHVVHGVVQRAKDYEVEKGGDICYYSQLCDLVNDYFLELIRLTDEENIMELVDRAKGEKLFNEKKGIEVYLSQKIGDFSDETGENIMRMWDTEYPEDYQKMIGAMEEFILYLATYKLPVFPCIYQSFKPEVAKARSYLNKIPYMEQD